MKRLFLSLVIFASILFSMQGVVSWGPNTHLNITEECVIQSEQGLIKQLIEDNYDACLVGFQYPDVGIFEYYTNFKAYAGMHNYNAVDEMLRIAKNDRERAFAYCYKIHLAEDGVSHNFFVPLAIKNTKIPNYLIHPIQELKIEGFYLNIRASRMMEGHAEFDGFVEQAVGRDWSGEAEKLNKIIGGGQFYTDAYIPSSSTFIGRGQNYMYKIVAKFVSRETGVDYYNLAIDECKGVLRGETSQLDPSGEQALAQADSESALWLYGISFLIIIIILIVSWRFRIIGFNRR